MVVVVVHSYPVVISFCYTIPILRPKIFAYNTLSGGGLHYFSGILGNLKISSVRVLKLCKPSYNIVTIII